jgi:hypothetical protein
MAKDKPATLQIETFADHLVGGSGKSSKHGGEK